MDNSYTPTYRGWSIFFLKNLMCLPLNGKMLLLRPIRPLIFTRVSFDEFKITTFFPKEEKIEFFIDEF